MYISIHRNRNGVLRDSHKVVLVLWDIRVYVVLSWKLPYVELFRSLVCWVSVPRRFPECKQRMRGEPDLAKRRETNDHFQDATLSSIRWTV